MGDRIVGVREVAPRLGVHPKTLQRMCKEGRSPIPATLTGGGWKFRESDIDKHIAELFDRPHSATG